MDNCWNCRGYLSRESLVLQGKLLSAPVSLQYWRDMTSNQTNSPKPILQLVREWGGSEDIFKDIVTCDDSSIAYINWA
jgi:hypothetical protein